MFVDGWTIFRDSISLVIAATAVGVAAWNLNAGLKTLQSNERTRRAELLSKLHQSFFVEDRYKEIRDQIDGETGKAEAACKGLVQAEKADFTDYLNFFEFSAYLCCEGILSLEDLDAMLGYYVRQLRGSDAIKKYIRQKEKSFESLQHLFDTLK